MKSRMDQLCKKIIYRIRCGHTGNAGWQLLAVLLIVPLLASCGRTSLLVDDTAQAGSVRRMYYIDEDENQLKSFEYKPKSTEPDAMIDELLGICRQPSADDATLLPLLPEGITVEEHHIENDVLQLNMSESYATLPAVRELLTRAGLVKTLTQVETVNYVEFRVAGNPLKDGSGTVIGKLGRDSFVEDASRSINAYKSAVMQLYYTNESGTKLIPEERTVYYNTSEPLERAVVEEIVRGTTTEGHYPTVSSETRILSVAIQEGVCYVNLDETFNNSALSVSAEVQLYSIVNALADTCHVSRVQFSINGVSSLMFRDSLALDVPYEKNEALIEK
ncbi:MAG: GerMN domain-containing protein [Eubacterium sp.]|nr:GerMN domain-containing protein [Eubacterium sp.]